MDDLWLRYCSQVVIWGGRDRQHEELDKVPYIEISFCKSNTESPGGVLAMSVRPLQSSLHPPQLLIIETMKPPAVIPAVFLISERLCMSQG